MSAGGNMDSTRSKKQSRVGGCGCLLLILAFGYLVVGVILRPIMPDAVHGVIDGVFDALLCGPDEQYQQDPFLRGAMRWHIVGEGDAWCETAAGQRRDISWAEFNVAIVLFVVPVTVGAVLAARGLGNVSSGKPVGVPSTANNQSSLSDKLRELDEAYRNGLITQMEYEQTREGMLKGMEE
jgi:hypothetical protein